MTIGARETVELFEAELASLGRAERAVAEKRYLKSDLDFLGVRVPEIRRCVKSWLRSRPTPTRLELVGLVRALWRRRVHELRMVGVELLVARSADLEPDDLELVEWMIRRSSTWAYVDPLAARIAGALVERHPELEATLDRWAEDDDFWIRRSALLALLPALRRGEGDWSRFQSYADSMLEEREFFIRKAIGWVLREAAKVDPDRVSVWLSGRTRRISGVTLREAVRYLSPEDREALLAAYRAR